MTDIRSRLTKAFTTITNIAIEQVAQAVELGIQQVERAVESLQEQVRENATTGTSPAAATAPVAPARNRAAMKTANRGEHKGPRPLDKLKIAKIREGASRGMTLKEIALYAGVSTSSAQRYRGTTGTPRRPGRRSASND